MYGFQEDVVPKAFVPETGFINFDLYYRRYGDEERLAERGQKVIHPGKLALSMTAPLAEHGIDKALDRYKEIRYKNRYCTEKFDWVFTERATSKPELRKLDFDFDIGRVCALRSRTDGVEAATDHDFPRVVFVAGSLNA